MKRLGSALAVGALWICCAFVSAQELATDIGERIVRLPVQGGNPRNLGQPCNPERLGELIEHYGRTTRGPTLWIYAENDDWFGPGVARDWHGR